MSNPTNPITETVETVEELAAEEWDEYAAAYLEKHPEISAAIPAWAEEVEIFAIDEADPNDATNTITDFRFTRAVGMVTLYGLGARYADGAVTIDETAIIFGRQGEFYTASTGDAMDMVLTLSVNLQNVLALLGAEVSK